MHKDTKHSPKSYIVDRSGPKPDHKTKGTASASSKQTPKTRPASRKGY